MTPTKEIKVVIADDHALFRSGVQSVFQTVKTGGFTVVGEAANGKEAIDLVKTMQPDVILMDVEMPVMNGIEATKIIKQEYPLVRTVALSYWNTSTSVVDMISAGADGYLLKGTGPEELLLAVRTVHNGIPYFSPMTTIHMSSRIKKDVVAKNKVEKINLTKRETEILSHICHGESSKEIATALSLSKRTIDTFRNKMMKKAGVKSVLQLLIYALKAHIIQDLFMLALLLTEIDFCRLMYQF